MSSKYTSDTLDRERTNSYGRSGNKNAGYDNSPSNQYDNSYSNGAKYGQERSNVNKYEQMAYQKASNNENVRIRGRGSEYER